MRNLRTGLAWGCIRFILDKVRVIITIILVGKNSFRFVTLVRKKFWSAFCVFD